MMGSEKSKWSVGAAQSGTGPDAKNKKRVSSFVSVPILFLIVVISGDGLGGRSNVGTSKSDYGLGAVVLRGLHCTAGLRQRDALTFQI